MSDIHVLAIDLAKRSFEVCATDRGGAVLFNRTVSRPKLMQMLSSRAPCIVDTTASRLEKFRILPLSGAQFIDNNDRLSRSTDKPGDVKERCRIEIRMRKTERP